MRNTRLVLVFARLPHEESREKPLVGLRRRVEALHERLFRHTIDVAGAAASSTGARARLVTHGELAERFQRDGLEVRQQVGDTFAARLEHAVRDAFADGYREVVLVGGDAPALTPRHLEGAFARLAGDRRSAVVGPACDGGYYLLALNAHHPALFTDVPLGTPDARRATESILAREGYAVSYLEALFDLDDERDVRRIARLPGSLRSLAARLLAHAASFADVIQLVTRRCSAAISARGPPAPRLS